MPVEDRRTADGQEQVLGQHTGNRAEGKRRIGRPEGSDANFRNALARSFRENAEAVEVRGLALVGCHAEGGVALGVLDRIRSLRAGPVRGRPPSRHSGNR